MFYFVAESIFRLSEAMRLHLAYDATCGSEDRSVRNAVLWIPVEAER